jgi:Tfp pilus assembly protein PilF
MSNSWAEDYLKSLLPEMYPQDDSTVDDGSELDELDDPMLELYTLWQSTSVVKCLRLALSTLERCPPDAPARLVADLIECADDCAQRLSARQAELAELQTAAEADSEDGDAQAGLGFALDSLDEAEAAVEQYHNALEHVDSLCFLNHRDCLNNIGWNLYLRKEYENALPFFEEACRIEPSHEREATHEHTEDLKPPYKLALENLLLCLTRLGRLAEAAEKLTWYFDHIGRLPRYETEALRKLGLDADVAFIRRRIERHTTTSGVTAHL